MWQPNIIRKGDRASQKGDVAREAEVGVMWGHKAGKQAALEAGKTKEINFRLGLQERTHSLAHPFSTPDLQNYKIMNQCCF